MKKTKIVKSTNSTRSLFPAIFTTIRALWACSCPIFYNTPGWTCLPQRNKVLLCDVAGLFQKGLRSSRSLIPAPESPKTCGRSFSSRSSRRRNRGRASGSGCRRCTVRSSRPAVSSRWTVRWGTGPPSGCSYRCMRSLGNVGRTTSRRQPQDPIRNKSAI